MNSANRCWNNLQCGLWLGTFLLRHENYTLNFMQCVWQCVQTAIPIMSVFILVFLISHVKKISLPPTQWTSVDNSCPNSAVGRRELTVVFIFNQICKNSVFVRPWIKLRRENKTKANQARTDVSVHSLKFKIHSGGGLNLSLNSNIYKHINITTCRQDDESAQEMSLMWIYSHYICIFVLSYIH